MMNLTVNNNATITSVQLTEQINQCRMAEGNGTELQHKTLLAKIENEQRVLEEAGIDQQNILLTSYLDKSKRQSKCYKLDQDAVMNLLLSESVIVRHKVIAYVRALETQLVQTTPSYMIEDSVKRAEQWIIETKQAQLLLETSVEEAIVITTKDLTTMNTDEKKVFDIYRESSCTLVSSSGKTHYQAMNAFSRQILKHNPLTQLQAGFETDTYRVGREVVKGSDRMILFIKPLGQELLLENFNKFAKALKQQNPIKKGTNKGKVELTLCGKSWYVKPVISEDFDNIFGGHYGRILD